MPRFVDCDISLTIENSAGKSMDVHTHGDIDVGEFRPNNRNSTTVKERRKNIGRVPGDELEHNVSFTVGVKNETFTHATASRVLDALLGTGAWPIAATTDPGGREYAVKLTATWDDGNGNTGGFSLPAFQGGASFRGAGDTSTMAVQGTNIGAPTFF